MHGYRKGCSALSNAVCHRGKRHIAKYDIKDFFPNIHYIRVNKIFLKLGFSSGEARLLTKLTTVDKCVPHGFITSPKLALITLINADKRLKGLFQKAGLIYTFYSDDITVSGNCDIKKFEKLIIRIFNQEGFKINEKKIVYRSYLERQEVTGLIVNQVLNLPVEKRQELEAILYNCLKLGAQTQLDKYWQVFGVSKKGGKTLGKFRERVWGRINYLRTVNPKLANKFMGTFNRIDWS